MRSTKTLLAAAALALVTAAGAGAANAATWDHHPAPVVRQEVRDMRYDTHRRIVDRDRVLATLRLHHYRGLGDPAFVRGHYVVKAAGHFGRPVFIEINPYTGAFVGEFRI